MFISDTGPLLKFESSFPLRLVRLLLAVRILFLICIENDLTYQSRQIVPPCLALKQWPKCISISPQHRLERTFALLRHKVEFWWKQTRRIFQPYLVTSSPHFLFLKTHEAKNRQLEIFFWKLEFWNFFLKKEASGWQAAVFLSAVNLHHIVGKLSFSYQMSQVFILFVLEDRTRDGVAFLSFVFENTSGSFLPTKLLTVWNRWDESYEKFNMTPIS